MSVLAPAVPCLRRQGYPRQARAVSQHFPKLLHCPQNGNKEFPFIARPFRTSELSFRVGGPIDRFDVYAGNRYEQGNIIAEIDPRDFRIRKERAEAVYRQSKAEFERIEALYRKERTSPPAPTKRQKADYISAKTAFDTAVCELEDTRLTAPFTGYVGEVYIEKFQDVKATQPVVSLIDIHQLRIEIYVPQEIAYAAQSSDSIRICFDAIPGQTYRAKVIEVSKGTTRNNLSYLLTAILPNEGGKLLCRHVRQSDSGHTAGRVPPVSASPRRHSVTGLPRAIMYGWLILPHRKSAAVK